MPFSLDNIHPLFIHFPIALLSTGLFFDILFLRYNQEDFEIVGFYCMLLGALSCLFANITGLMAFLSEAAFIELIQFTHALLNLFATLIFVLLLWIRIKFQLDLRFSSIKRYVYLLIHILSVAILFYASYLGALGEREWLH